MPDENPPAKVLAVDKLLFPVVVQPLRIVSSESERVAFSRSNPGPMPALASPCQPAKALWLRALAQGSLASGFAKSAQGHLRDSANLSFPPFLPQERTVGASQLELGSRHINGSSQRCNDRVTECKHTCLGGWLGRFQSSFQVALIGSCSLGAQSLIQPISNIPGESSPRYHLDMFSKQSTSDDEDDVEDVLFLPKTPSLEQPTFASNHVPDSTASSQRKLRMRLTVVLFAIVLAFETGGSMLSAPMTRIFESITCQRYYEQHDKSKIGKDGYIPEELCKNKEIQREVAIVKGYGELFDALSGVLLSMPYGLLADKYGRKPVFCICIPGFVLNMILTGVILYATNTFPLRMVWLSTLAWLFGGGFAVASTMVWTMMADVTAESQRAALFFKFGVAIMVSEFISSVVTSCLMKYNPWIPMCIGWSLTLIGILPAVGLPETKGAFASEKEHADEFPESIPLNYEHNSLPREQFHEQSHAHIRSYAKGSHLLSKLNRMASEFSFIFQDKHLMFLLSTFLVYRLSRGTSWLLIQYISKRYHWTLANANFLNSFKYILTVFLFLVVLPLSSWYLTSCRRMHFRQKDLTMSKASVILLLIGTFIMGISPSISLFITGLVVQTLGIGFVFIIRSLATTMVHRDQTARLYTAIEMLQSIGVTIASPTVTMFFNWGLEMGDGWIGLPWVVASGLFGATAILLWMYRLPSLAKQSVALSSIAL
ncbi:hypothetical protein ACO22_00190 [Paracoccidioides brasiliensis]|uniref:Major facilitator superfamily (MFS) profile domain-containing protein n=1 Tax=Paracoccidioides brasiliensis TaxID=121759 RepID=A0A1D2JQ50_PARBR|nr:hypothetical protein ACO22_00190 [Paracoccidioides brasiliensis]